MARFQIAKKILLLSLVFALSHVGEVPDANAERRVRRNFRRNLRIQRRFFNRRPVLINRGQRFVQNNNNNNLLNLRDQKAINGFSEIRTAGRAIVGVNRFQQAVPLFIDGFGNLLDSAGNNLAASTEGLPIVKDLAEFYLQNLDNFAGAARTRVLSFLARNAPNTGFFGTLTAQIRDGSGPSAGVVPQGEKYKKAGFSPEQIRTAALSWLLNTFSNSCTQIRVPPGGSAADGTFTQNLNGFIENTRLAALLNENPYACGDPRAVARVDWLVARGTTPEVYYSVQGLSKNLDGLGRQLGVKVQQQNDVDFTGRPIARILVAGSRDKSESRVGVNPQRVLEVQDRNNSANTSFYRSYDFIEHPTSGRNALARDVKKQGIGFQADASEIIFTKCNSFMGYYLADGNGNRAREAPASIAIDGGKSVTSPDRCMKCHANGFHGGGKQNFGEGPEKYTDHFSTIAALDRPLVQSLNSRQPLDQSFHSRFFTENEAYLTRQRVDSSKFQSAKVVTGAHLQDPDGPREITKSLPVLFDMAEEYRKPLTLKQAAAELGLAPTPELASLLVMNKPDPKKPGSPLTIDRENFEQQYCEIRSRFGLGSVRSQTGLGTVQGQAGSLGRGGINHDGSDNRGTTGPILRREAPTN